MSRADRILAVAVVLFALLVGPAVRGAAALSPAKTVTIEGPSGSTQVALSAERTLNVEGLGGIVVVVVHDGHASVRQSSCPDHVCVSSGVISRSGEALACVPNGVTVRIGGERDDGLDAVTR
jgi:hypothetical protein